MADESAPAHRMLPPRALLLSLVAQIPAAILAWPPRPAGFEIAAGLMFVGAGLGLNLWTDRLFKQRDVGVRPFSAASQLVETGPFRFTRNPMYLGIVLASAGTALATGIALNLIFPAVFAVWLNYSYIVLEEQFLARRFGDDFTAYRRRIPRWLGWTRSLRQI